MLMAGQTEKVQEEWKVILQFILTNSHLRENIQIDKGQGQPG